LSSKAFLEVFVVDGEEAVEAIVGGVKAVAIVVVVGWSCSVGGGGVGDVVLVVAVGVLVVAEVGLVGVVKAVAVALALFSASVVVGVEAFISSTRMPLKNYEL